MISRINSNQEKYKNTVYKKLCSIICSALSMAAFSQQTVSPPNISGTENYVYTREYLAETSVSSSTVSQVQSVTYFDGLGRQKQNIAIKASPSGKDIVTIVEYDALGRQTTDFLPMPQQSTTNGGIYTSTTTPYTEQVGSALYGGTAPFFTKKEIENSPLGRPLSSTAPGYWSVNNKKVTLEYQLNIANEVKKYGTATTWSNGATSSVLNISGSYAANQLYKNIATDEDNNVSIEFKDKLGHTVLVRKMLNGSPVDTYYVYNEYQNLAFVLQPIFADKNQNAATALLTTSADMDELCYQYRYDQKGRLVEKKLPGKGWEYMVYDKQDRLIFTQDAKLASVNNSFGIKGWLFTKYDQFSRVAYTGFVASADGRATVQNVVDTSTTIISNNESRSSSATSYSGLDLYYTNVAFPSVVTKLLSVNYYDTYPADLATVPANIQSQAVLPQTGNLSTKSLPVASFVKNIEDDKWTKTYTFYDQKARPIATHSYNHLGGFTKMENVLDFAGVPQKTMTYHTRSNPNMIKTTIEENFTYDDQNRLTVHTHKVNSDAPVTLAKNKYNEIGQLVEKQVGGDQNGNNPIQTVSYTYNIRGWMTGINSGDILYNPSNGSYLLTGGKLFGYNIRYNDPQKPNLGAPKYNGNIAEVDWISRDVPIKRYGYQYDGLNRLLKGNYQDPGNALPESHLNDETLTYDLNGNIKTLVRNAKHAKQNTPVVIDNLDYNQYDGNKILRINDLSNNASGYEGGNGLIGYDANGNMTTMPDKMISAITYNHLNLPKQINQNANVTNYYYRADGMKVKKKFVLTNSSGTNTINTEYLDGFQYSTPNTEPLRKALEKEDDATMAAATAGEEEAFLSDPDRKVVAKGDPGTSDVDNMILSFFPTAEGYYDYENLRYIYQYKDHLGNVRLSYVKNSAGVLRIMDSNDYYPFGMSHLKNTQSVYDPMAIPYNYKYNGKELQETGMYDYGARFYMPDIGRFGQYDPLAEKTMEPYAYVYNNPVMMIDPTGMEGEPSDSGGSGGEASNGGDGGSGESGGAFAGGDPPVKGAGFGGNKYDGGINSFSKGSDGNLDTEIQGVSVNGSRSEPTPLPPFPGFTLGGGGGMRSKQPFNPYANCGHCHDGPIKYVGGFGDPLGIFELLGMLLASEDSSVKYMAVPLLVLKGQEDKALKILAAEKGMLSPKIHGNSLGSPKPTWGYKLFDEEGTFLKNGITSKANPEKRYTNKFMLDKKMTPVKQFPNRKSAWDWEYKINQTEKGPWNKNNH